MGIVEGPFQNITLIHEVVTAALTGTALSSIDEADIVDGGKTIIITLSGSNIWRADDFDSIRQNIIDGLDSNLSETNGWNAEVRDKLAVTTVVRTSDKVATVTLSAQAGYDITAEEVITCTIPPTALEFDSEPITATPTLTIAEADVFGDLWEAYVVTSSTVYIRSTRALTAAEATAMATVTTATVGGRSQDLFAATYVENGGINYAGTNGDHTDGYAEAWSEIGTWPFAEGEGGGPAVGIALTGYWEGSPASHVYAWNDLGIVTGDPATFS